MPAATIPAGEGEVGENPLAGVGSASNFAAAPLRRLTATSAAVPGDAAEAPGVAKRAPQVRPVAAASILLRERRPQPAITAGMTRPPAAAMGPPLRAGARPVPQSAAPSFSGSKAAVQRALRGMGSKDSGAAGVAAPHACKEGPAGRAFGRRRRPRSRTERGPGAQGSEQGSEQGQRRLPDAGRGRTSGKAIASWSPASAQMPPPPLPPPPPRKLPGEDSEVLRRLQGVLRWPGTAAGVGPPMPEVEGKGLTGEARSVEYGKAVSDQVKDQQPGRASEAPIGWQSWGPQAAKPLAACQDMLGAPPRWLPAAAGRVHRPLSSRLRTAARCGLRRPEPGGPSPMDIRGRGPGGDLGGPH